MGLCDAVTSYLFIQDQPEKADVILLPGSSFPEPAEHAAQLYLQGWAPLLLPSGDRWLFRRHGACQSTECDSMAGILMKAGVPEAAILREERARHTLDNARLSKAALDHAGIRLKTAIICCQSFHARRCLKAYSKHFTDVRLIICPVPTRGFDASDWHKKPIGTFKVITELLKCTGLFFLLIRLVKAG